MKKRLNGAHYPDIPIEMLSELQASLDEANGTLREIKEQTARPRIQPFDWLGWILGAAILVEAWRGKLPWETAAHALKKLGG